MTTANLKNKQLPLVRVHPRNCDLAGAFAIKRSALRRLNCLIISAFALLLGCLAPLPALAAFEVPAGTTVSTGGGLFDLACADLRVAGTVNLDNGQFINVRAVNILAGGVINGSGGGVISVAGNWSNSGSFIAANSTVNFIDNTACAPAATISGNTSFANVSFASTLGKTYTFVAGSTQTMLGGLTVSGTAAMPIVLASSMPGQYANFNSIGAQRISNASVDWMAATGNWLAAGLMNRNLNGNVLRWFGQSEAQSEAQIVPALSLTTLVLLISLMIGSGLWLRRKQHLP